MRKKKKSPKTGFAPDGRQGRGAGAENKQDSALSAKTQPKPPNTISITHFTGSRNAGSAETGGRRGAARHALARLASVCLALAVALSLSAAPAAHAAAPDVVAYAATGVTASSASISGYISANKGINIRTCGLQYQQHGSSSWINCYSKNPASANDRSIGPKTLTGLGEGTTYYYRSYATNVNGETSYSAAKYFITNINPRPPAVEAYHASGVTASGATVSGYISANKGIAIRTCGIEHRLSGSSSWTRAYSRAPANGDDRAIGPYTLTGLAAGTVYQYRAYAANVNGDTGYSLVYSFTTAAKPAPPDVTAYPATGVTASGVVSPEKIYKIKNANSGKYLNVSDGYGGNGHDGRNVFQKESNNSEFAQEFRIIYDSAKGAYRIHPICAHNGRNRVLDIKKSGSEVKDGCNVQLYLPNDDVAQLFKIESMGSNKYRILSSSNTSVAMAAAGTYGGTDDGKSPIDPGNVFMQTYRGGANQLWYFEEFPDRHEEYYESLGFVYPMTPAGISDGYGYRQLGGDKRFHNGLDIRAPEGTPLKAPFNGTVVKISRGDSMGNYIIMEADSKTAYKSDKKIRVVYMHLTKSPTDTNSKVKENAKITPDTLVGNVGKTGKNVTGPHLHMTMITDGSNTVDSIDTTNNPQMYYNNKKFTY